MKIDVTEKQIQMLVDDVVRQVKDKMGGGVLAGNISGGNTTPAPVTSPTSPTQQAPVVSPTSSVPSVAPTAISTETTQGVFADVETAVSAAQASYERLMDMSVREREVLISAMRKAAIDNAQRLGALAVEETRLGRVEAKIQKIILSAKKTPGTEDLTPSAFTGDDGLTLVEPAPYGVVGAITPSTNPPSTVINNGIGMVAAGNGVVINPHPAAKRVTNETVTILNRAIAAEGGPPTLLCSVAQPTMETGQALMTHQGVKLLMVTGGEGVVKVAMTSGKKTIAAGPGNPPVIVDDTANITRAARNIVDGASFDNNVLCIAEKEIFVFDNVAQRLKDEMLRYGAYEVTGRSLDALVGECIDTSGPSHPKARRERVGKDAASLLSIVGIQAPKEVRLILAEVDDINHPLIQAEQLMPIIPLLRAKDLDQSLGWALQAEHGFHHTAVMHSEHVSRMSRVARAVETSIFVKNAPSYAGLGFGGEGFTTMSIATPTGEGVTSARTFTRQRRCVLAGAFRII